MNKLLIASMFAMIFTESLAQNIVSMPDVIPITPSASSLMKSIKEPVGYDRGLVDISIPLYTARIGDIVMPIVLKYHHKGLKTAEYNHWLGQGWSLEMEPQVSVAVNGKPDNLLSALISPDSDITRNQDYLYKLSLSADDITDENPDEYFYRLLTKSGSFFFKKNMSTDKWEAKTLSYEPINISVLDNNNIKIIDDNGVEYRFCDKVSSTSSVGTGSWKITEIISSNRRDTVRFNYVGYNQYISQISDYVRVEDTDVFSEKSGYGINMQCVGMGQNTGITVPEILQSSNGVLSVFYPYYYTVDIADYGESYHSRLEKCIDTGSTSITKMHSILKPDVISFGTGKIRYVHRKIDYSPGGLSNLRLVRIDVLDNHNNIIRSIEFNNRSDEDQFEYPILESVVIKGSDNLEAERYEFDYYDGSFTSVASNHLRANIWGYDTGTTPYPGHAAIVRSTAIRVNGAPGWPGNINGKQYFIIGENSNRIGPASTNGMLKSITNTLGGKTEYVYEPDRCFTEMYHVNLDGTYKGGNTNAGGLRIKEIYYSDPLTGQQTRRRFRYGEKVEDSDNEDGLGIIKFQIYPEHYRYSRDESWRNSSSKDGRTTFDYYSSWLHGDNTFNGIPIVYNRVTEYNDLFKNGEWINAGKNVYQYNHLSLNRAPIYSGTNLSYDNKTDWCRGNLIKKETFKVENGDYQIVEQTDYVYQTFWKDKIPVGQSYVFHTLNDALHEILPIHDCHYYRHDIETGCVRMTSETTTNFLENGEVIDRKEYFYDNTDHLYPTRIRTTNSNGSVITQNLLYPLDTPTETNPTHSEAKNRLVSDGRISPILETHQTTPTGTQKIYNNYKVFENGNALPYMIKTQRDDHTVESRIIYHAYDSYSNPRHVTKDGITNVVYLWGYTGKYLVAEIQNATFDDLKKVVSEPLINQITDRDEPTTDDWLAINSLRSALPNALVTTFTHIPLVGVSCITDPSGRKSTYEYDSFGRLKTIRDDTGNIVQSHDYHYKNQ